MRIALFTDTYPPFINGVSTSVFNLAKTLKEHGQDVLVVTTRSDDGELELEDGILRVPGVAMKKIYGYRLTNIYSSLAFNIVKQFEPDVIHNQTDSTIGQFAKITASRLNIPIVYTYHTAYEDYTYYATHGFFDRFAKHFVRTYSNVVANQTSGYITPSFKTKEYVRNIGSDVYINVIPTGIDFSAFNLNVLDENKIKELKEKYSIKENTKVFLILGRIAKEKSMDYSIKCIAYYHEKHPERDVKLLIVGNGPQKEELEKLVEELNIGDITVFVGAVPAKETPYYYSLADIYTSASITETQGLTFMEAMALQAIVVARFDDNLSGTIIDGKTGFFFSDEETFAEKAEKIFNMSEEELNVIRNNALDICDVYSIERFYQNVMGVYKRAIRKFW